MSFLSNHGFKSPYQVINENGLNANFRVINYKNVPFGIPLYTFYNGALRACRIYAILYNCNYNGAIYQSAYMLEIAKEDGTTFGLISEASNTKFFASPAMYDRYLKAERWQDQEANSIAYWRDNNLDYNTLLLESVPYYDTNNDGYSKRYYLWEFKDNQPTKVAPNLGIAWADASGFHFEDPKGFYKNTDKYFPNISTCVSANKPIVVEFGKPVEINPTKEYTIEVSVKVKAKSYEEALKVSKTIKVQ